MSKQSAQYSRPIGSTIPRMYGLPKTHKSNLPLRPILSMKNTPTHKLAQWLADVLSPIRRAVSSHVVKDSFDFVNKREKINFKDLSMCLCDVTSLFTNVPLHETIDYISRIQIEYKIKLPVDSETLKSLILLCTHNVQFLANGKFFFQKDDVAMGSPLGPILADIFMGYIEHFLIDNEHKPLHYFRFVDDTFAVFRNKAELEKYFNVINNIHKNLNFTVELPERDTLAFLDVKISSNPDGSVSTSVYRKPTWSGLYLHFFSFVPNSYKRNLVSNLYNRARRLCSPDKLDSELFLLFKTLQENGYPSSFIEKHSCSRPTAPVVFGPEKKPAFLTLPFLGDLFFNQVKKRVRAVTALAFPAIEPRFVAVTRRIHTRPLKDPLPISCASNVVYKFDCGCGSSYLGRTERWLASRVKEHLPAWLRRGDATRPRSTATPSSAVTRHTMSCPAFDRHRDPLAHFRVLVRCRHPSLLPFAEATHIADQQPDLCVMKDFVVSLALPWN